MAAGMNCYRRSLVLAGVILTSVLIAVLMCGCIAPENETDTATNNTTLQNAKTTNSTPTPAAPVTEPANIAVTVIKFEPARPCQSCTKLGNYARETIELYFPEEYQSGEIRYQTVNYQDPDNIELVKKYGVSGSALLISMVTDGNGNEEEIIDANDMWRYVGNKEEYMAVFKTKLEGILSEYEHDA